MSTISQTLRLLAVLLLKALRDTDENLLWIASLCDIYAEWGAILVCQVLTS